jgi:general secretion pathway protein G
MTFRRKARKSPWIAQSTATGEASQAQRNGFTLIELLIVVSIIGILATLAVPSYQAAALKAREATLRQDLFTMRDLLDQHRADQGRYPESIQALVSAGYLRSVPADPFTASQATWQEVTEPAVSGVQGGVFDIYSGSELVGSNGVPYNQW